MGTRAARTDTRTRGGSQAAKSASRAPPPVAAAAIAGSGGGGGGGGAVRGGRSSAQSASPSTLSRLLFRRLAASTSLVLAPRPQQRARVLKKYSSSPRDTATGRQGRPKGGSRSEGGAVARCSGTGNEWRLVERPVARAAVGAEEALAQAATRLGLAHRLERRQQQAA